MTEEILNLNLDNFICINLKMVSGEEIVAHVDPDNLLDVDSDILILHDPFLVTISGNLIVMSIWLLANRQNEQVICKNDIMINNKPDKKFEDLYLNVLEKKMNMENEEIMETFEDKIISSGTDTIN